MEVAGLSALDPGKQGLKHAPRIIKRIRTPLSALDPGKQGLKHFDFSSFAPTPRAFSA